MGSRKDPQLLTGRSSTAVIILNPKLLQLLYLLIHRLLEINTSFIIRPIHFPIN